ncbi:MAG: response regulator [Proteobacteria bacterium]|nr:response regulator [Pseudomonadota bacterium]
MRKLVKWLAGLERSAADVYVLAAEHFADDISLSRFLKQMSKDELMHYSAMRLAMAYMNDVDDYPAVIAFDEEARWALEEPLIRLKTALMEGMTKRELIESILLIESSELNELFIYVVNSIREKSSGSVDISLNIDYSIDMECHKRKIERFVLTQPDYKGLLKRRSALPVTKAPVNNSPASNSPVSKSKGKRILIVDDTVNNLFLLKALFENQFTVDTARNGAEACVKLKGGDYAAIISDVKMPKMSGIEFYKRACEIYPGIDSRFIFYSSSLNDEQRLFIKENGLKYLTKPSPFSTVRETVATVMC